MMGKHLAQQNQGNKMRSLYLFVHLASIFTCALCLLSCGDTKGGDHIPDFKNYQVAALPEGATANGVRTKVFGDSEVLRPIVSLSDRYDVCIVKDQFTEQDVRRKRSRNRGQSCLGQRPKICSPSGKLFESHRDQYRLC
jgi:hypothetical protein